MSEKIDLIGEGLEVNLSVEPGWVGLQGIPYDVKLTPGEALELARSLARYAVVAESNNKENN